MEKIHEEIGLPLKETYADIGTDPNILKKLGKEGETAPAYAFLGIAWNLITNEITPTTYFNMSKKFRGVSGERKLMNMSPGEFTDPSFQREITRRTLSRLAAQAYDRLGIFIGPIIT